MNPFRSFGKAMTSLAFTVLATLCTMGSIHAQADTVRRDPRIELFCILFHLAGAPEYSTDKMPQYAAAVDDYFSKARKHAAVATTREIRKKHGTGYFHPMNLAVHLTMPPALAESTPFDGPGHALGRRWPAEQTRAYLEEVRAFYREARVEEFLEKQKSVHQRAVDGLRGVLEREGDPQWFERYFGKKATTTFSVVPAPLNGGSQYAAMYRDSNGAQEAYAIIGIYKLDQEGMPRFDSTDADNVVHEFTHTLTDRAVATHLPILEAAGPSLYAPVAAKMREQAYGEWQTMVREAVVRAVVVRFIAAHRGEEAARRQIAEEEKLGFTMTGPLVEVLKEYEAARETHPEFDDVMPRIVATLNEAAGVKSPG